MCALCSMAYATAAVSMAFSGPASLLNTTQLAASTSIGIQQTQTTQVLSMQILPGVVGGLKLPQLKDPEWLATIKAAEQQAAGHKTVLPAGQKITVTYDVATKGAITADFAEFKRQANETLNDARGWARMGVFFQEVPNGGQFTIVLSEASQMPTFSSGCTADYSCNVGRYVVINQDRWLGATSSWNTAGGSMRDYRHMVINHETGHWLGHDHQHCGGPGQAAPVMQQQSIDLEGCSFNAWPLAGELWSTRLGISI